MKIIRPNNITYDKICQNKVAQLKTNPVNAICKLIKLKPQYVQCVKSDYNKDGFDLLKSGLHPFVQAAHLAFANHLPLIISPDIIWYLISNGVATHINKNAETLRHQFVSHEGKKLINIYSPTFTFGSSENNWDQVIAAFSDEIKKMTKNEVADLIVADFSTTTVISRVVSQIVLMDAMKKYFESKITTCCGIPEIRITGSKQDWEKIKLKTEKLVELIPDLKIWFSNGLSGVLDNFINVFDDKINDKFWNSLYKAKDGSGGPYITGWILALFPYLDKGEKNSYVWKSTWEKSVGNKTFSGVTTDSFDYHMNQVPFVWEYLDTKNDMFFVGGLIGVSYNNQDQSVSPVFGYAIAQDKVKCQDDSESDTKSESDTEFDTD